LDRTGDGYTLVGWSPRLADVTSAPFAYAVPPEPRDALGYGCASTGAGELAALGLVVILLFPRRRVRWAALALAVAAASSANAADASKAPQNASAQPRMDAARALNKQGLAALAAGRTDEAIALFEQARAIVNAPSLIYNLAEAHRRAGHVAETLELYHAYLAAVPDPAKRADVRDFEVLEHRQVAQEPVRAEPAYEAPKASTREAFDNGAIPAARRRWMRAPGIFAGVAWLPKDERAGYETLFEVEAWDGLRFSAGALISPRPGGRVALERRLYQEDDFSVGVALRGMVASFPGSALKGGGGGFSLRFQATPNVDISSGVFLEYYATQTDRFVAPVVTAGLGLHL
jgi:tetratricopeptide (TPR) repeat protein